MEIQSPRGRSVCKTITKLQECARKDESHKKQKGAKVVLACEHGINVNLGRKTHVLIVGTKILPSLVTDSLWTVKFDADGKVLKRHEHDHDV